ncbi:hypothetical protein ACFX10_032208 [Malus domestica]
MMLNLEHSSFALQAVLDMKYQVLVYSVEHVSLTLQVDGTDMNNEQQNSEAIEQNPVIEKQEVQRVGSSNFPYDSIPVHYVPSYHKSDI